jgi:hypothetical protein
MTCRLAAFQKREIANLHTEGLPFFSTLVANFWCRKMNEGCRDKHIDSYTGASNIDK